MSTLEDTLASLAKTVDLLAQSQLRLQQGLVRKDISGVPDAQMMHGPGGLFSNAGIDELVVNASLTPRGMDGLLPVLPTVYTNPVFSFITGFESDGEAEADGVCDDGPGGIIEACNQTAQFGRVTRSSQEIEINKVMQMINRGETTPLRVLGEVLGTHKLLSSQVMEPADWINYVTRTQMVIVGVEFQRKLAQMLWQGNPVNNSANGGYQEFPGLDMLISAGKVDCFTGIACPALDPDIKDFEYDDVAGSDKDIVVYLSMMDFYLRHVAERTSLDPVEWVIAMRPELFEELTAVWPCRYLADRCSHWTDNSMALAVINDKTNTDMRDAMRNGKYLTINGRIVQVVTDDGIYEANSANDANLDAGEFASDIYFIPLRAHGIPTLYWEHLDYSKAAPDMAILNRKEQFWPSDAGRYMWTIQQKTWCFKIQGKIEPRVILRTPHLAGRLENVMYRPLQHLKSPFPESPYFKKGGEEHFDTAPSFYSEWNPPGEMGN